MKYNKNIHVFGGGTVAHISNHFAITAPAYGSTAFKLANLCRKRFSCYVWTELTRMAGGARMETNEDIFKRIKELKEIPDTKIIFLNCALCDWEPNYLELEDDTGKITGTVELGKYAPRLSSRGPSPYVTVNPADKVVNTIREGRKDIFLVAFKATCGATKQEMYEKGLRLCKEGSCNLVLINDTKTHWNMIITPEEAAYHETQDRDEVLKNLVDMTFYRSQLTFTQSTVVDGHPVKWDDAIVPHALRTVVDHCVKKNAYKPFKDATVGHFACKLADDEFLTSIRKSNFNKLYETGLVKVKTDGPDTVIAYGAKPSVGGQSQRRVFKDHPGYDCIVHFHCPLRPDALHSIPVRSQREVECGSHQCGQNTSDGLMEYPEYGVKAVYLDQHGPNIVFNKDADSNKVIEFIEKNFDLEQKTGGYQLSAENKT